MKETKDYYLFWRHQFGQWTLREMRDIDGTLYNCCEQYMMAKKAVLFGDHETYARIMAESSPKIQQQLGRAVNNLDPAVWGIGFAAEGYGAHYDNGLIRRNNSDLFRFN